MDALYTILLVALDRVPVVVFSHVIDIGDDLMVGCFI